MRLLFVSTKNQYGVCENLSVLPRFFSSVDSLIPKPSALDIRWYIYIYIYTLPILIYIFIITTGMGAKNAIQFNAITNYLLMNLFHKWKGNWKKNLRRKKRKKRKSKDIEIKRKCLINVEKYMINYDQIGRDKEKVRKRN